jgi:hypothetical protein
MEVKVALYSLPIITLINYVSEQSLLRPYVTRDEKFLTRLVYTAASLGVILVINRQFERLEHKKMCDQDKEFLEQWGHIQSPYHSSLSDSDSSVQELIIYP